MTNCLNPFAVHLVMDVGPGVVQASIALLADEQVGEVHLEQRVAGNPEHTANLSKPQGDATHGPSTVH